MRSRRPRSAASTSARGNAPEVPARERQAAEGHDRLAQGRAGGPVPPGPGPSPEEGGRPGARLPRPRGPGPRWRRARWPPRSPTSEPARRRPRAGWARGARSGRCSVPRGARRGCAWAARRRCAGWWRWRRTAARWARWAPRPGAPPPGPRARPGPGGRSRGPHRHRGRGVHHVAVHVHAHVQLHDVPGGVGPLVVGRGTVVGGHLVHRGLDGEGELSAALPDVVLDRLHHVPQTGPRLDQGGPVLPGPGGDVPRLAQGLERRRVGPFGRREQQISRPSSWWPPSRRSSLPPGRRGEGSGRPPCGRRPRSAT